MIRRPAVLIAAAVAATGAAAIPAWSGPVAADGPNRLQLEVDVKPAKASPRAAPRPVALRFHSTYSTATGERPSATVQHIRIRLPRGMRIDGDAVPQCRETAFNPGPSVPLSPDACPPASRVGQGTAVADPRPVADPITVPVDLYNATIELDAENRPISARPGLIVHAPDVDLYFAVEIRERRLDVPFPATPAAEPAPYTLTELEVALPARRGPGGDPYVRAPRRCEGAWRFTETYRLDSGPLTARDAVRCRPAR